MKREPVLIGNAIVAIVAVIFAAVNGAITEGIVLAAALAVASVVMRTQVTPNASVLVHTDHVEELVEPDESFFDEPEVAPAARRRVIGSAEWDPVEDSV